MPERTPIRLTEKQVTAFRLARHHLAERAELPLPTVISDMVGAQAQVLSAAQISAGTRAKGATLQDLESAIWKDRTLVRAWCMRRTMFLVPSRELAVFVRGITRRSAYNLNWALGRAKSKQAIEKLLDAVMGVLDTPRTRMEFAKLLSETQGYKLKSKRGGGWGGKSVVPWIEAGGLQLPVGFLLHLLGARHVICSGPSRGNESTYVRADKWIRGWKDATVEEAERELLSKYLKAYGPATLTDFALWAGMYLRDAKEIWREVQSDLVAVEVGGKEASTLESDISDLQEAEIDEPIVRLLPLFDSYLLGHKSHRNIVEERNHKKVYRNQGWVSPVFLVNGAARGLWTHTVNKDHLEVRVNPFTRLPSPVSGGIREQANELGRFFGTTDVRTTIT